MVITNTKPTTMVDFVAAVMDTHTKCTIAAALADISPSRRLFIVQLLAANADRAIRISLVCDLIYTQTGRGSPVKTMAPLTLTCNHCTGDPLTRFSRITDHQSKKKLSLIHI